VALDKLERVRAIMPPDGTDLVVAFGSGPPARPGEMFAEDVPVRFVAASGEMGGVGRRGFYESWADWLEPWESYRIYFDDVVEREDRVVFLVRLRGVTKHGGVEMEHEAAGVFRFDGDTVVEIVFTMDRDEALAD
jgi:hypothetical protein